MKKIIDTLRNKLDQRVVSKKFYEAHRPLAGMEVIAMIRKRQLHTTGNDEKTPPERFYALVE